MEHKRQELSFYPELQFKGTEIMNRALVVGVCTVPFLRSPAEGGPFFLRDKGDLYREVTLELIP